MQEKQDLLIQRLQRNQNGWTTMKKISLKIIALMDAIHLKKKECIKKIRFIQSTIRTVDAKLAKYFYEVLKDHHNPFIKGLTIEGRILPQKRIREIYSLTPVIQKSDEGYWRNQMSLDDFEKHLFENAVKKYKQYTGENLNEDFQLYTDFHFLNRSPIPNEYKEILLVGRLRLVFKNFR